MDALPYSLGQTINLQPSLRLRLLGSPVVSWNGKALTISRRLVRALLYRLGCAPEPVTRGHLQLLFWPDVPESLARRNLSHLLTHLRRALPLPEVLEATSNEVWLEPGQIWCDVFEFRVGLLDPEPEISHLRQLINLYRAPFLEGFDLPKCPDFEHWCLVERSSLEQGYLESLERLVEYCTERGEINLAIKYAQKYLKSDPLSETMHQRLIQLFACAGDRHLAMQQFEHCSKILSSALGVAPLPETKAIYRGVVHERINFPESSSHLISTKLPDRQAPLIGREDEIRKLDEVFSRLEDHQGQVVLISGEAGIGKSRLMQDIADNHQAEARILNACGQPAEQTIPYQPIQAMLRSMLGLYEMGAGSNQSDLPSRREPPDFIDPIWLSEISRLLPETQVVYPQLAPPIPLEPESARTRLFDAVCYLILTYAIAKGPLLLCLDDLQWMDSTTKAWLVHIGHFISRGDYPVLILGAYRTEDADQVLEVRHSLARAGVLEEIKLPGLSAGALLDIQRCLVGQRSGDELLVSQLHPATGGNPFYFIEIIHKLIEEGQLEEDFKKSVPVDLPESVREAVHNRLQSLTPISLQVLEAGAVLGQSFSFEMLRLTSGRTHAEIMSALQELTARLLLLEAPHEYHFVHDITRQQVEENLGQLRKQLLHRRAGRAYHHLMPDAYSALAHHFEEGGDFHKALTYHGLSANQAQLLFAWQVAEFHLGRMLHILSHIDPGCEQPDLIKQRGDILAERASIRHLLDHLSDRDADLWALEDLSEASNDDSLRLQSVFNHLRYLILDGDYPRAIATAENGLALLDSNPGSLEDPGLFPVARSRLLAQIGFAYYFMGKPMDALGLLEEARSLCEQMPNPEACGRILHILGYVYFHLADYKRSLECQQHAYSSHAELGNHNLMAWDLVDIGTNHKYLGDVDQAVRSIEDGQELAGRVGSPRAMAYALTQLGSLMLFMGDYSVALANYQQVLGMQKSSFYGYIIAAAEAGTGLTLYFLGDYAYSRHWFERAVQRARASNLRRWVAETLIHLGMLDLAEGHFDQARQHLEEGLLLAQDCLSGECLAAGFAAQARLERLCGNAASAFELAGEALRTAGQVGLTGCEMWAEIEVGLALMAQGDPSSALEHAERAISLAAQAGQDWVGREEAHLAYACVLRAVNQEEKASLQDEAAQAEIQVKADLISDPHLHSRYLEISISR